MKFPQSPQLHLSLSDGFSDHLIPREPHSSVPVGIGSTTEEEKTPQSAPQSAQQPNPALRGNCRRCGRHAVIDRECYQCVGCNSDDLREAGLLILIDSSAPDRAKRFFGELREVRHSIARK